MLSSLFREVPTPWPRPFLSRQHHFECQKLNESNCAAPSEAGAEVIVQRPDGERLSSSELSRSSGFSGSGTRYRGPEVVLLRGDAEISPAEAGELLGISRQFVDRLIDTGKLPGRRLPWQPSPSSSSR